MIPAVCHGRAERASIHGAEENRPRIPTLEARTERLPRLAPLLCLRLPAPPGSARALGTAVPQLLKRSRPLERYAGPGRRSLLAPDESELQEQPQEQELVFESETNQILNETEAPPPMWNPNNFTDSPETYTPFTQR